MLSNKLVSVSFLGAATALGGCLSAPEEPARPATEVNCIAAVEAESGVTGATLAGSKLVDTRLDVLIDVPGAATPWGCVVDAEGNVSQVYPT